jgi:hypothetical protein
MNGWWFTGITVRTMEGRRAATLEEAKKAMRLLGWDDEIEAESDGTFNIMVPDHMEFRLTRGESVSLMLRVGDVHMDVNIDTP